MKKFQQLAIPYIVWACIMLLLPMLLIAFYSVIQQGNSIVHFKLTLDNYVRFFTDKDFLLILWRSLWIAIKTTIICLLIGYPIAYFISKNSPKIQQILVLAITLPTWINMLVRTYAWIGILSSDGIISSFLGLFGIHTELLYTEVAVLIGMVYNFLPFMILPIHTALTKMDHSLIEASYDLGANPFQAFWNITFRLSLSGVLTGITMVFLPSISSFMIPKLLGGGQYALIGNFIEQQFVQIGDWNFGSAVSMILAILVVLMMAGVNRIEKYTGQSQEDK